MVTAETQYCHVSVSWLLLGSEVSVLMTSLAATSATIHNEDLWGKVVDSTCPFLVLPQQRFQASWADTKKVESKHFHTFKKGYTFFFK